MMLRALRNLPVRDEKEVILQAAGTIRRMRISQIYYVEIQDHLLLYHTDMGRIEAWGKLSDVEAELDTYNFCAVQQLTSRQHAAYHIGIQNRSHRWQHQAAHQPAQTQGVL